jgi:poly-gamma-glutamate capsule biosynthesis protein CapA/YwtB (metallophosphatase superfamily)
MAVPRDISLMAVGDVNLQRDDAIAVFGDTAEVLAEADVLMGNQEGVLSDRGTPLTGKREVGSSCVRGSITSVTALAQVGFNAMSLANNHGMDFGAEALANTKELLRGHGIATAGAGANLAEAHQPALLQAEGTKIAMLAYTSVFPPFGYRVTEDGPGVAVIAVDTAYETPSNVPYQPGTPSTTVTIPHAGDLQRMVDDVRRAKAGADVVVVQLHWGVVGLSHPLAYMRQLGRAAVDAGADLVLGNHAHVLQAVESYRGRLICYSLNHFAFEHIGHIFPNWPFVHDTVIFRTSLRDGQFVQASLLPVTMHPLSHDLSLTGPDRALELTDHLNQLSVGFSTTFEFVGDQILIVPGERDAVPDNPPYRDFSPVVMDTRGVLARAAHNQPAHA